MLLMGTNLPNSITLENMWTPRKNLFTSNTTLSSVFGGHIVLLLILAYHVHRNRLCMLPFVFEMHKCSKCNRLLFLIPVNWPAVQLCYNIFFPSIWLSLRIFLIIQVLQIVLLWTLIYKCVCVSVLIFQSNYNCICLYFYKTNKQILTFFDNFLRFIKLLRFKKLLPKDKCMRLNKSSTQRKNIQTALESCCTLTTSKIMSTETYTSKTH